MFIPSAPDTFCRAESTAESREHADGERGSRGGDSNAAETGPEGPEAGEAEGLGEGYRRTTEKSWTWMHRQLQGKEEEQMGMSKMDGKRGKSLEPEGWQGQGGVGAAVSSAGQEPCCAGAARCPPLTK